MNNMKHKIDYRNGLAYDGIYIYRGFEITRGDILGHEANEYGDVTNHWFFGEIKELFAMTGKFSDLKIEVDDLASVIMKFSNNIIYFFYYFF